MKHEETKALNLQERAGLPDALRVLLDDYPRELWEEDAGFSQLIRFWLDRHVMFRRIIDALQDGTRATMAKSLDPQAYLRQLSRYGGMFVNELHMHHVIEDTQYFPRLKTLDARILYGFDILDRDHHTIDARLQSFATQANGVLQGMQNGDNTAMAQLGPLVDELAVLEGFLNRHLIDEEELIVPVLLKYQPEGMS